MFISIPVEHGSSYATSEKISINRDKVLSSKINKEITLRRELKRGLREKHFSFWDISWDMINISKLLEQVISNESEHIRCRSFVK